MQPLMIADYEILHEIGEGGMAKVLLGRRVFENDKVKYCVIKIPNAATMADPEKLKLFERETAVTVKLNGSNIVPIFEVGVWRGLPYIVMKFISGKNVFEFIEGMTSAGETIDWAIAGWIAIGVGYGLLSAHNYTEAGVVIPIIHRDVSVRNAMIAGDGGVLVMDFGLAKSAAAETTSNLVRGAFRSVSPEQINGFEACAKSDAFGLGTILWSLLEQKEFRSEIAQQQLLAAALAGVVSPLTRTGLPEQMLEVVHGLLKVDRDERMSVGRAVSLLEEFVPIRQTALRGLMSRGFGAEVNRSGGTQVGIRRISPETLAAIEIAQTNLRIFESTLASKVGGGTTEIDVPGTLGRERGEASVAGNPKDSGNLKDGDPEQDLPRSAERVAAPQVADIAPPRIEPPRSLPPLLPPAEAEFNTSEGPSLERPVPQAVPLGSRRAPAIDPGGFSELIPKPLALSAPSPSVVPRYAPHLDAQIDTQIFAPPRLSASVGMAEPSEPKSPASIDVPVQRPSSTRSSSGAEHLPPIHTAEPPMVHAPNALAAEEAPLGPHVGQDVDPTQLLTRSEIEESKRLGTGSDGLASAARGGTLEVPIPGPLVPVVPPAVVAAMPSEGTAAEVPVTPATIELRPGPDTQDLAVEQATELELRAPRWRLPGILGGGAVVAVLLAWGAGWVLQVGGDERPKSSVELTQARATKTPRPPKKSVAVGKTIDEVDEVDEGFSIPVAPVEAPATGTDVGERTRDRAAAAKKPEAGLTSREPTAEPRNIEPEIREPSSKPQVSKDPKPAKTERSTPEPTKDPKPARKPTATVTVGIGFIEVAVIQIAGKRRTLKMGDSAKQMKVPFGSQRVRWKLSRSGKWRKSRRLNVRKDCDHFVVVEMDGPKFSCRKGK